MRLRDSKLWVTGGSYSLGEKFASGKEGVLEDVQYFAASPSIPAARLNLVIKVEDGITRHYSRHLVDADTNLLKSLYPKLKDCVGLPIGQILDKDF